MIRRHVLAFSALVALAFAGCSTDAPVPGVVPLQQILETPAANLPEWMRYRNWTSSRGEGSCVIASSCYNHNWVGDVDAAKRWRRQYAGGQTATGIMQKHDADGMRYYFTRRANPELLDWTTDTRRSALIWYWPFHCVNFTGFHRDPTRPTDPTEYAWLLDNNRPAQFIRVPRDEFLKRWAGYGGFALARQSPPVPPPLFDATAPAANL